MNVTSLICRDPSPNRPRTDAEIAAHNARLRKLFRIRGDGSEGPDRPWLKSTEKLGR